MMRGRRDDKVLSHYFIIWKSGSRGHHLIYDLGRAHISLADEAFLGPYQAEEGTG